jgi:hypothetical protein
MLIIYNNHKQFSSQQWTNKMHSIAPDIFTSHRIFSARFNPQEIIMREKIQKKYTKKQQLLTFVKYVGWFQDSVYQDAVHLHNYSTKNYVHFNHLSLTHHVSCV